MTQEVAVFPLGTAYLPGELVSLRVFERRYLDMMDDIAASTNSFVSVLISHGSEVGGGDKRHDRGVLVSMVSTDSDEVGLRAQGTAIERVRVLEWLPDDPYPRAIIERCIDDAMAQERVHDAASALTLVAQGVRMLHERLITHRGIDKSEMPMNPVLTMIAAGRWWERGVSQEEVARAFWIVASQTPCGPIDRHELLRTDSLIERIARLRATVEHVTEVLAFQMGY